MRESTVPPSVKRTETLDPRSERVRRFYDRSAARYDRKMARGERGMLGDARRWVGERAAGAVLEIAVGTGRNLPHYPAGARVTGIDVSQEMLALAAERAEALGRAIELRCADAHALPWSEASFDTVVSTASLCSIPDERQAIAEAWRVLRPGGRLVAFEHVRSPNRAVRVLQELVEPIALATHHDHLLREPVDTVRCQGFEVEELRREKAGVVEYLVARKPV